MIELQSIVINIRGADLAGEYVGDDPPSRPTILPDKVDELFSLNLVAFQQHLQDLKEKNISADWGSDVIEMIRRPLGQLEGVPA